MLTVTAKDINGNNFILPSLISFCVNQDYNVPADDLSAVFPLIKNLPELSEVTLKENNEIIFTGIVDEQQAICDSKNAYTKIVARSMAALLLDNESKPINYTNPTTSVIFSNHLKPLGFSDYKGEELTYYGNFNVPKGTTQWQAFYSFAVNTYGKIPRVEADGTVNFLGIKNDEIICFSNDDGVKYTSIKVNNKRCALISKVMVKAGNNGGYITEFVNQDAINRGVKTSRYLDATFVDTNVTTANKMLINAKNNSYEITIICPERLLNVLGARAYIKDSRLGLIDGLFVSGVTYNLNSQNENTIIKLKKEN